MAILIDGYNLLNAAGIVARGVGPGTLARARLALLNFLAESLEPKDIAHTTVVFDAHNPPPGLPRSVNHRGITALFSVGYEDADSQIEELIGKDSAPRQLTVVSSDHRLQRAARRRKAKAVGSDLWYAEVVRARHRRHEAEARPSDATIRPVVPLLEEDVSYWIRQFGGRSALEQFIETLAAEEMEGGKPSEPDSPPEKPMPPERLSSDEAAAIGNPFPPGYGEDLLEDFEEED
ncbi:MAG TPA: NYN domain-containing protein [Thermoguttaceae bacterium]|nr:NYN domain-containing protein [Thermoguttaceae bacterium]